MPDGQKIGLIIGMSERLLIGLFSFIKAALEKIGKPNGVPSAREPGIYVKALPPCVSSLLGPVKTLVKQAQVVWNVEILWAELHRRAITGNSGIVLPVLCQRER